MNITPVSSFSKNYKFIVNSKNNTNKSSCQSQTFEITPNNFEKKNITKIAALTGIIILGAIVVARAIKKKKVKNILNDIIITDKNKLKNLLLQFNNDDFNADKNFKVNLHIHSTMSDGKMHPLEVLRQANERANKLPNGEKFTFSLTDHDSIEGVKIIIDEIKKSPQKYSKLNFIPGIELSAKYHNSKLSGKPVEFDFLIYGFNVNNKTLINQLEKRRSYLQKHTVAFFNELNYSCGVNLSFPQMQKETSNGHLKHLSSNGYLKALIQYTKDFCYKNRKDGSQIKQFAQKHFGDSNFAYGANPDLLSAIKLTKDTNAICSLAHPGKLNFNNVDLKCKGTELSNDIISTFINSDGDAIESHYMTYKTNNQNWWNEIRGSMKPLGLAYYKTGGYDCHGTNIMQK